MAELSPVESARAKGKSVIKPIVFGNESKYFGKKRETDGHTHSWSVYVKPFDEKEDMSSYIKKVCVVFVFVLLSFVYRQLR